MIQLRAYELAVELYKETKKLRLPHFLQDQVLRASSSVVLNLAEGYGKKTTKDRQKYFSIAKGSIREVQAVADMEPQALSHMADKIDHLAASIYKLTR